MSAWFNRGSVFFLSSFITVACLSIGFPALADVVYLKDGSKIFNARIMQQDENGIVVQSEGKTSKLSVHDVLAVDDSARTGKPFTQPKIPGAGKKNAILKVKNGITTDFSKYQVAPGNVLKAAVYAFTTHKWDVVEITDTSVTGILPNRLSDGPVRAQVEFKHFPIIVTRFISDRKIIRTPWLRNIENEVLKQLVSCS